EPPYLRTHRGGTIRNPPDLHTKNRDGTKQGSNPPDPAHSSSGDSERSNQPARSGAPPAGLWRPP
ncbi:hypothetical protein, partial [Arthrobacter sp.]|uniref:hypothetical protein n=1 Tax=Arthrobacter sp. TaxID=1667 RepID=UPI002899BC80